MKDETIKEGLSDLCPRFYNNNKPKQIIINQVECFESIIKERNEQITNLQSEIAKLNKQEEESVELFEGMAKNHLKIVAKLSNEIVELKEQLKLAENDGEMIDK